MMKINQLANSVSHKVPVDFQDILKLCESPNMDLIHSISRALVRSAIDDLGVDMDTVLRAMLLGLMQHGMAIGRVSIPEMGRTDVLVFDDRGLTIIRGR